MQVYTRGESLGTRLLLMYRNMINSKTRLMMRSKVNQPLLYHSVGRVDEEKLKTMDKVRYEFNQFDMALKRRLQDLLMNVESEVMYVFILS